MSHDTTLGEDERVVGFPIHLTERALALVKAEGLRQAAEKLTLLCGHGAHHDLSCDTCLSAQFLLARSQELEAAVALPLKGATRPGAPRRG